MNPVVGLQAPYIVRGVKTRDGTVANEVVEVIVVAVVNWTAIGMAWAVMLDELDGMGKQKDVLVEFDAGIAK